MFWKNITWSVSDSEGDDDNYLLDVRKTLDVPPATDLNCIGTTTSNSLSNTTCTTAAGPKDWTKVQTPDVSPDLINVNHEHLPGDSIRSSFVSVPNTIAKQETKWKSNQWLVVSHMTLTFPSKHMEN